MDSRDNFYWFSRFFKAMEEFLKIPESKRYQVPINNYRIRYIVSDYDLNNFQDKEYQGWYILKNTTVYERYNEKTNTRVRIDFRDGNFFVPSSWSI